MHGIGKLFGDWFSILTRLPRSLGDQSSIKINVGSNEVFRSWLERRRVVQSTQTLTHLAGVPVVTNKLLNPDVAVVLRDNEVVAVMNLNF